MAFFFARCEAQIKSKALTAHLNGRKHRDAVARFKQGAQRAASIRQQQNTGGVKRTSPAEDDDNCNDVSPHANGRQGIPSKKVRTLDGFDGAVDSGAVTKKVAKDKLTLFGQNEEYQVKSPWQIEASERKNLHSSSTPSSSSGGLVENVIEDLPDGFFDDKQLNSRLREAMDKQKRIDSELNRFFQEVADIDVQRQEKDEELVETSAIRHDLEECSWTGGALSMSSSCARNKWKRE